MRDPRSPERAGMLYPREELNLDQPGFVDLAPIRRRGRVFRFSPSIEVEKEEPR